MCRNALTPKIGVLGIVCLLTVASPTAAQNITYDEFRRGFMEIAFGSKYRDPKRKIDRIVKWKDDPRIIVMGNPDGAFQSLLERHLDQVRELTGLHPTLDIEKFLDDDPDFDWGAQGFNVIAYVPDTEAQFWAFLSDRRFFSSFGDRLDRGNVLCVSRTIPDGDSRIFLAIILFSPNSFETENLYCIVEEFTHILGLTRDTDLIERSVFNDANRYSILTELDTLLLAALYSDRIEAGMTREQVSPILPDVYREITHR